MPITASAEMIRIVNIVQIKKMVRALDAVLSGIVVFVRMEKKLYCKGKTYAFKNQKA